MTTLFDLNSSELAILAAAFAIVFTALAYLTFILHRQMEIQKRLIEASLDRTFNSEYDDHRLRLERQIADLNLQLTRNHAQFDEMNHLVIDGQKHINSLADSPIDSQRFLSSLGITQSKIQLDKNLVFVLTPFHPSERRTYSAILEAFSPFGVRVVRGDEEYAAGDILSHIIKQLVEARLVIANVSTRNANVFYEMGIAHALGKDVVMISNTKSEIPFDIASRRIIFYEDQSELIEKLQVELARRIFQPNR